MSKIIKNIILDIVPYENIDKINKVSNLFDELINLIFQKLSNKINQKNQEDNIHYLLYEEQIFCLANYRLNFGNYIIRNEIKNIDFDNFNIKKERKRLLGNEKRIENTSLNLFISLYKNKYEIRWIPKSRKLVNNVKKEKKKRNIKNVDKNHFITKSFIKRYWTNSELNIHLFNKENLIAKSLPYGKFGHKNNIYSNNLEDYFGLIESNSINIIEKLINIIPINIIEKNSLITFIIIHYLRNPYYFKSGIEREFFKQNMDYQSIQNYYESLFDDNIYKKMTENIFINQWCLLKSNDSLFVLPDTSLLYMLEKDKPFIIFPISPKYCLSILPYKDNRKEEEKIIPTNISLKKDETILISSFLINIANKEFVSNSKFKKDFLNSNVNHKTILNLVKNKYQ